MYKIILGDYRAGAAGAAGAGFRTQRREIRSAGLRCDTFIGMQDW